MVRKKNLESNIEVMQLCFKILDLFWYTKFTCTLVSCWTCLGTLRGTFTWHRMFFSAISRFIFWETNMPWDSKNKICLFIHFQVYVSRHGFIVSKHKTSKLKYWDLEGKILRHNSNVSRHKTLKVKFEAEEASPET